MSEALIGIGCLALGLVASLIGRQVQTLADQLDFFEHLLQHARAETRIALAAAQQTQALVNSAVNGAQARRSLQGGAGSSADAAVSETDMTPLQLLEHRMRFRQSQETVSNPIQPPTERFQSQQATSGPAPTFGP